MSTPIERAVNAVVEKAVMDRDAWCNEDPDPDIDDLLGESHVIDGKTLRVEGPPSTLAHVVLNAAADVEELARVLYAQDSVRPWIMLDEADREAYRVVANAIREHLLTTKEG